jgi:hypothetical protein
MNNLSVKELRILAKGKVPGYYKLRKEQLIAALNKEGIPVEKLTVGQKLIAKQTDYQPCCSFAFEFQNQEPAYYHHAPCHAVLNYSRGVERVWIDLNVHHKHSNQPKMYTEFIDWMLKHGPFKHLFSVHSAKEAYEGKLFISGEHPKNEIIHALIGLREGSEFPKIVSLWKEARDAGLDGRTALCFGQNFIKEGESYKLAPSNGAHKTYSAGHVRFKDMKDYYREGKLKTPGNRFTTSGQNYLVTEAISGAGLHNGDLEGSLEDKLQEIFNVKPATRFPRFGEKYSLVKEEMFKGLWKLDNLLIN